LSGADSRPTHWRGSMRALITGGAGFVGSHLADALLARGDTVYVIDDLSTGSIENIETLKEDRRFHYVIDSVMSERVLAELIDRVDVVFHLAAAVGVRLIVESPVNTIETNVHGTEMVLKIANKKKKKVLLMSTSEVYGKSNAVPFREDSDLVLGATDKGRWSYACSKAIDEFLGLAYHKEKRLPVVVVRLFNTVGPRQTGRYGMVIPNFVKQALLGHPLTVFGDGNQTRCFTYVGDVVGALLALADHPDAVGQVFNIGNDGDEISILALAERVKARTRSQSVIELVPYDKAYEAGFEDMPRRVPDLTKLRALIGYEPKVHLDEILDRVIAFFESDKARA
jgi:nucleoside-diphosphate-sugar epimerase